MNGTVTARRGGIGLWRMSSKKFLQPFYIYCTEDLLIYRQHDVVTSMSNRCRPDKHFQKSLRKSKHHRSQVINKHEKGGP